MLFLIFIKKIEDVTNRSDKEQDYLGQDIVLIIPLLFTFHNNYGWELDSDNYKVLCKFYYSNHVIIWKIYAHLLQLYDRKDTYFSLLFCYCFFFFFNFTYIFTLNFLIAAGNWKRRMFGILFLLLVFLFYLERNF